MQKLWAIVRVDYLTLGDVGDLFPRIPGGIVSISSDAIEFFAVIGVLVVEGSIDSKREDLIDHKVVGSVFFGVFVVIWLMFTIIFLIFVGKDIVQPFYDRFSVTGAVSPIYLYQRRFTVDRHFLCSAECFQGLQLR